MAQAVATDGLEPGLVRLRASVRTSAAPETVGAILGGDATWLGSAQRLPPEGARRRFAVDLRLRVGTEETALATFSKAAVLEVGPLRRSSAGTDVEIGWRAAGLAPLFPVFSGHLHIGDGELRLDGIYAPPGGAVGRVADRLLLHTAATATAGWLLRQLDRASTGATD